MHFGWMQLTTFEDMCASRNKHEPSVMDTTLYPSPFDGFLYRCSKALIIEVLGSIEPFSDNPFYQVHAHNNTPDGIDVFRYLVPYMKMEQYEFIGTIRGVT